MADSIADADAGTGEDRLPWLEAVDDEDEDQGVAPAKLIGGVVAALAVVGLVIGGAMWVRDRNNAAGVAAGAPETVAVNGPYKVKPSEPGGMAVPGQGDTSYAASQGADPHSNIDLSALPEAPVAGTKAAPADAKKPEPAKPAAPAAAKPEPAKPAAPIATKPATQTAAAKPATAKPTAVAAAKPGAPGAGTIQLGSFLSAGKANEAWTTLSKRFGFLGGLNKNVVTATVNAKTVYRLQTSAGAQANSICGKLKVAGESCIIVKS